MSTPSQDHCWKCGSDASSEDKFCRECGTESPALFITWDWKEQPPWGAFNRFLKPFGVEVVDLNTETDQYAISIRPLKP